MFDTERNQPIRVCATASGFSMRILGIANGTLMTPMPSSQFASSFAFASKVDFLLVDRIAVQATWANAGPEVATQVFASAGFSVETAGQYPVTDRSELLLLRLRPAYEPLPVVPRTALDPATVVRARAAFANGWVLRGIEPHVVDATHVAFTFLLHAPGRIEGRPELLAHLRDRNDRYLARWSGRLPLPSEPPGEALVTVTTSSFDVSESGEDARIACGIGLRPELLVEPTLVDIVSSDPGVALERGRIALIHAPKPRTR